MPVPDQVRDDVSGIQIMLELLASDFRQNDKPRTNSNSCETIFSFPRKKMNKMTNKQYPGSVEPLLILNQRWRV